MKVKGVNPIEQHVEKLVVLLLALALAAVVGLQLLSPPNQVSGQAGASIPVGEVYSTLGDKASEIVGQLQEERPDLPEVQTPDLAASFEQRLGSDPAVAVAERPLGPVRSIPVPGGVGPGGPVAVPSVPAPATPLVAARWSTADPFFVASRREEMNASLPPQQPYDMPSITVEAALDGTALRAALESAPEGERPLPRHWWTPASGAGVEIVLVEAERMHRRGDGAWSDPEPVLGYNPIGGPFEELLRENGRNPESLKGSLDALSPQQVLDLAAAARQRPETVTEPFPVPSIAGPDWTLPSELAEEAAGAGLDEEAERLLERFEAAEARLDELRDQLSGANDRTRARLEANIRRAEAEVTRFREELELLGIDPDARDPAAAPAAPRDPAGSRDPRFGRPGTQTGPAGRGVGGPQAGLPLVEDAEATFWLHDIAIEPGVEYRYRVRVTVNNPLFGHARSLGTDDPERLALAERAVLTGAWSEWSEPRLVAPESFFFVTGASARGDAINRGGATATAEVYRIFYGYYRMQSVRLTPGEPMSTEFTLPPDLPTFEIEGVSREDIEAFVRSVQQDGFPPDDELPEWLDYLPESLPLEAAAVLLDVAELPSAITAGGAGRVRTVHEAVFFDPGAGIVARRPDIDRSREAYAVVTRSAELGREAEVVPPNPAWLRD